MQITMKNLEEAMLTLSVEERVHLLDLLLASLETESGVQEAWLRLAEQRRDAVLTGKVAMVPGDDALARVRKRLT